MSESNAVSSHGCRLTLNGVDISDLGDVTPPRLFRRSFDRTLLLADDDSFWMGRRESGIMSFSAPPSALDAVYAAWIDNTRDAWNYYSTDGAIWVFSGFVVDVSLQAPVDDRLQAMVQVKPTGPISFVGHTEDWLLLETGGGLLTEGGDHISLE